MSLPLFLIQYDDIFLASLIFIEKRDEKQMLAIALYMERNEKNLPKFEQAIFLMRKTLLDRKLSFVKVYVHVRVCFDDLRNIVKEMVNHTSNIATGCSLLANICGLRRVLLCCVSHCISA